MLAVLVAVSVAGCVAVLLITTEAGETPHVVGLVAPEGAVVTTQLSVTVPENELPGVTVMVEVFPLVAPGATARLVGEAEREKPLLLVQFVQAGACQKFPQPAKNGVAASKIRVQLPILIAAPLRRCRATRS